MVAHAHHPKTQESEAGGPLNSGIRAFAACGPWKESSQQPASHSTLRFTHKLFTSRESAESLGAGAEGWALGAGLGGSEWGQGCLPIVFPAPWWRGHGWGWSLVLGMAGTVPWRRCTGVRTQLSLEHMVGWTLRTGCCCGRPASQSRPQLVL